ncbi:MAG: hypothetical protein EOQ39_19030 [Mesorhizobium sp.]|uniref:hypothetical protein n=1 Tax=Mesorhizobium sp. TaxID=1871066 RepID=UPI000FE7F120|nr:hypothetical protein [Mesorhizobium sp.]RWB08733.1 MAG: hypothetical protein EOQ37_04305 [Mesorhizobium sp.]RWB13614.1 MAG: hypothetical protein EOQ39_19030 [Mesorhizobium sp.]
MIVPHFGLHWMEGDIALLVQQGRVDHILGVQMDFDVKVVPPRRHAFTCPHDISLGQTVSRELPDDPLVNAFLPIPKDLGEKALFVGDTVANKTLVNELLRLSSPKATTLVPLWMYRPEVFTTLLNLTNLQPLVVFGYRNELQMALSKLLEAAMFSPRRLIFMGPQWTVLRQEAERVHTSVQIEHVDHLPLEQIGAARLRQRMMKR